MGIQFDIVVHVLDTQTSDHHERDYELNQLTQKML